MAEVIEQTTMNVTPMTNILVVITDNPMKPLQSLYELIDNSIDSFNRSKLLGVEIKNPLIDITIPSIADINKNQGILTVRDNAVGLTYEETNGAVTAGYSGKNKYDTLGLFGMGFNIATGKLGVETHFITTRENQDYAIDVRINLKEMTRKNSYDIPCQKVKKETGFTTGTIVEVSQWWEKGNPKRTHIEKLAKMSDKAICDAIGRVYASILREKNIKIFVNGKRCEAYEHCCWAETRYVETKKYGKIYAKYTVDKVLHSERRCVSCGALLDEADSTCPECGGNKIRTIEERVYGWVGIQRYLDRQDFGIDLIRNGRAICIGEKDAFFTWEDEAGRKIPEYPQENEGRGRIIGELHFDYVPVDYTKSDFVRTSAQWNRAIKYIRGDASLLPRKQGDIPNDSIMFKLYQGYHQMSIPGKKSLYIGYWSESQNKPLFDICIADECHHCGSMMYRTVFESLECGTAYGPFLLGMTATPWRSDEIELEKYFGKPLITVDMVYGMRHGFLANVDYRIYTDNIDWDGLNALSGNKFSPKQINRSLFINQWDDSVVYELKKAWKEQYNPRAIVFCGTIEHADVMKCKLNQLGFCKAEALYSQNDKGFSMTQFDRNLILSNFAEGRINVLCVVDIFNEGIDVPDVNIIVFQRVTHSRRIFIQQLGRGLRLAEDKDKVIVLDFVSDIRRFAAGLELKDELSSEKIDTVRINLPGENKVTFRRVDGEDKDTEHFLREWLEDIARIESMGENDVALRFPPLEIYSGR